MNALINYFLDLCLLRSAPQDLPASGVLLWLSSLANLLLGALLVEGSRLGPVPSLAKSVLDVALMLGVLRVALGWRGLAVVGLLVAVVRFHQTATAAMGSNALIGVIALPLVGMSMSGTGEMATLAGLLLLLLLIWDMIVLGHILRHAFDLALGQGVVVGVLYSLGSYLLLGPLFPID